MANDNEHAADGPKAMYRSIAGQLPDDAKRAVVDYLPKLEASVDSAVRTFGSDLATNIKERTKHELHTGYRAIEATLDAVRAVEEFTDEYKNAMRRFRRDGARLHKALKRLDRAIGQMRQIRSNGRFLDRQLRTFDERVVDFRRATPEGIGSAADRLQAFYDGWEPGVKAISVAKDGEIGRTLEKLREAVKGIGAATVDEEVEGAGQQEDAGISAGEESDEPARVEATRDHGAPLTTVSPADGTPQDDTDPAYYVTKLVDSLRCLAHKKLGEQACAASTEVQRAASKCDKLLRRRGTALKDAKEGVKATVLGVDGAKTAVAETARRVMRAIEDGVAAAKLESLGPH